MKVIQLQDAEVKVLLEIMDAGVRSLGLASANNAAVILSKINKAEQFPDTPPLEVVKEK